MARRGREADLQLQRDGRAVSLKAWGAELLDQLGGICELLDADDPGQPYRRALAKQLEKLRDPERTPSARHLQELRRAGSRLCRIHAGAFRPAPCAAARDRRPRSRPAGGVRRGSG